MNGGQKVVLWIGIVLIALAVAYPPWTFTYQAQGAAVARKSAGYHLITGPPSPEYPRPQYGVEIDLGRTILQLIAVAAITAGAFATVRSKSPHQP